MAKTTNRRGLTHRSRWTRWLRAYGARSWRELKPNERSAAYERGLRFWGHHPGQPNFSSVLPED